MVPLLEKLLTVFIFVVFFKIFSKTTETFYKLQPVINYRNFKIPTAHDFIR